MSLIVDVIEDGDVFCGSTAGAYDDAREIHVPDEGDSYGYPYQLGQQMFKLVVTGRTTYTIRWR